MRAWWLACRRARLLLLPCILAAVVPGVWALLAGALLITAGCAVGCWASVGGVQSGIGALVWHECRRC